MISTHFYPILKILYNQNYAHNENLLNNGTSNSNNNTLNNVNGQNNQNQSNNSQNNNIQNNNQPVIQDGRPDTPFLIRDFPYFHIYNTTLSETDSFDSYPCEPETGAAGPELFYKFQLSESGTLRVKLKYYGTANIDIYLLTNTSADSCLSRIDLQAETEMDAGTYYFAVDSFSEGENEYPGYYEVSADFIADSHKTREARGVWITRWDYSDENDVKTVIHDAVSAGLNQIYFQVRGVADAYYNSSYEPWAKRLSGTLGQNPGWDPLAVAVEEAHAYGIEIHAWLNTFTAWSGSSSLTESEPRHVLLTNPEWVQVDISGRPMTIGDEGYVCLSPNFEGVRQRIADVTTDIAQKYDVDGIHLDYIRFAGTDYSYDSAYLSRVEEEPGLNREHFQRENVKETVKLVYNSVKNVDSTIIISAAVWGIYNNTFGWSGVSEGFDDYFQDPREWTRQRIIDVVIPMAYWNIKENYGDHLDLATLIDDHAWGNLGRFVYPGLLANMTLDEIEAAVNYSRSAFTRGFVLFSFAYLRQFDYFDQIRTRICPEDTEVHEMSWKPR